MPALRTPRCTSIPHRPTLPAAKPCNGASACWPYLGRHAEALQAAETVSMETPRSWTILGECFECLFI